MKWSKVAMDDSFLMSHISPQVPGLNRGIWKKSESVVRQWTNANEKIYVANCLLLQNQVKQRANNFGSLQLNPQLIQLL